MLTMLKFVGMKEGRARPSSIDSQVEGECCACLFIVMHVGVVHGLNWELSVFLSQGERETRDNRLASSRRSLQRHSQWNLPRQPVNMGPY